MYTTRIGVAVFGLAVPASFRRVASDGRDSVPGTGADSRCVRSTSSMSGVAVRCWFSTYPNSPNKMSTPTAINQASDHRGFRMSPLEVCSPGGGADVTEIQAQDALSIDV